MPSSAATGAGRGYAELSARWAAAWRAGDLDATMALCAPAPVFQPDSGERWAGAGTIRRHFAALLKL
jgi:ketosteroid isomerase-like protein